MAVKKSTRRIQSNRRKEFNPRLMEGPNGELLEQYGFGDWIKRNVGNVAKTVGGAALTAFVPGAQSAGIGMMAGGVGSMVGDASAERSLKDQNEEIEKMKRFQSMSMNLTNESVPYAPTFRRGGKISRREAELVAGPTFSSDATHISRHGQTYGIDKNMKFDGTMTSGLPTYEEALVRERSQELSQRNPGVANLLRKYKGSTSMDADSRKENEGTYHGAYLQHYDELMNMRSEDLSPFLEREGTRNLGITRAKGGKVGNRKKSYSQGGIIDHQAGQPHEGPDGGIPVDEMGNPSAATGAEPIALTEQGELTWVSPDGDSYVFSDRTKLPGDKKKTFAKEAKRITNKYKLYLGEDFDKHDKLSIASMNRELEQLMMIQETINGNTIHRDQMPEMAPPPEQQMQPGMEEQMPMDMGMGAPDGMGMMPQPGMEGAPMMRRGGHIDDLTSHRDYLADNKLPYTLPTPERSLAGMGHNPYSIDSTPANTGTGPNGQWESFTGGAPLTSLAVPLLANVSAMAGERSRQRRRQPIRSPRATARSINLEGARTAARETAGEQRAVGRRAHRGAGSSAGAAIAGSSVMETDINRQLGQSLSESYMQEGLTNAQLASEAENINLQQTTRDQMMNREQGIRDEDIMRSYRDNLFGVASAYVADDAMSRREADFLQMMQPNFQMEQRKQPGWRGRFSHPERRVRVRK